MGHEQQQCKAKPSPLVGLDRTFALALPLAISQHLAPSLIDEIS